MRQKRHERIDLIFQAAIRIFSIHGFHEAKMDEIARLAGIAKGTIYYHFRSKEELFTNLVEEGMDRLFDYAARSIRTKRTPKEQLSALLAAQLRFCREQNELAKLLLAESFGSEYRQIYLRKKIRAYLDLIAGVLCEGVRQGDLRITYPRKAATAIFGALSILALDHFYNQEPLVEEQAQEYLASLHITASQLLLPALCRALPFRSERS